MTVADMRCDRCGCVLVGPAGSGLAEGRSAHRFLYHPGDVGLRDDSGLLCDGCLEQARGELGASAKNRCCVCSVTLARDRSLFVYLGGTTKPWQLCATHGASFLNTLRTVEPKLDPSTFTLSGDWPSRPSAAGG